MKTLAKNHKNFPRRLLGGKTTGGTGRRHINAVHSLSNKNFMGQHLPSNSFRDGSYALGLCEEREVKNLRKGFLTVIARDFKTPLNAITMAADDIERHYDNLSRHDFFNQLTAIKTSATYLTNIVNDFLTVEKIEHDKLEPEIASFDLQDFTQTVITAMKMQTRDWQDIKYVHTGSTSQVALDKKMLQHCLTNLISNAIKYSDVASHIEVGTEITGNTCRIWVKDHGIGIPEEEKEKLFEPFFRASNASGTTGTGLGLNIVKRYTELMNGNISVKSNEKEGAVFTLAFPLTPGVQ